MKIVFDPKLKGLALKLGGVLGVTKLDSGSGSGMTEEERENVLFVGRGMANKALKDKKKYPKCWEVGKVTDSIDYLSKVILDGKTLQKTESKCGRRKSPEHIVAMRFDYDCGGASFCTWMLTINREDVLKTDVYRRLDVNPIDGTKSEMIKKVLEEEKIPYLEIWEASLDDVENVLDNNGVVLISYQSEGSDEEIERMECGHYSIIFDIDEEHVWLIDPSYDEEYTLGYGKGVVRRTREEFEKLWIDKGSDGTVYHHWMMAVKSSPN